MAGTVPLYQELHQLPGMTAAVETFENEFLVEGMPYNYRSSCLLDGTSTDAGNTDNTSLLRKGLLMSYDRNSKKWGPWTYYTPNDATNNYRQTVDGVLAISVDVTGSTDRAVPIVTKGFVMAERLIVPGTTANGGSFGLAGSALRYAVGQVMTPALVLDNLDYGREGGLIYVDDDDVATSFDDYPNGSTFVYTGANAVTNQALPTPVPGRKISIFSHGDATLSFLSPVDNSIYHGGTNGNTLTLTDEGDSVTLVGIQTASTPTYGYAVVNASVTGATPVTQV